MQPVNLVVTAGEDRRQKTHAYRTYFFAVDTDTGLEVPLDKLPYGVLRKEGTIPIATDQIYRITETHYSALQKFQLKMWTWASVHLRPIVQYSIYLDIDPQAPAITMQGLGNVGKFEGRAWINPKTLVPARQLKSVLHYEEKAPALRKKTAKPLKKAPRGVMW